MIVCVAWNPGDNSDVGWVTFLANAHLTGPTTLTNIGLTFRQWNGDAGDKWREGKPIRVFRNFIWFVFV